MFKVISTAQIIFHRLIEFPFKFFSHFRNKYMPLRKVKMSFMLSLELDLTSISRLKTSRVRNTENFKFDFSITQAHWLRLSLSQFIQLFLHVFKEKFTYSKIFKLFFLNGGICIKANLHTFPFIFVRDIKFLLQIL